MRRFVEIIGPYIIWRWTTNKIAVHDENDFEVFSTVDLVAARDWCNAALAK